MQLYWSLGLSSVQIPSMTFFSSGDGGQAYFEQEQRICVK